MMSIKTAMTVSTVEPPAQSHILWHLRVDVFEVPDAELDAAVEEGMPALQQYNPRAAQVVRWHYGLDGQWPKSVDEIRVLLGNISTTGVLRSHERAVQFLRHYYYRSAERVTGGGVLRLWPDDFFRLRRFFDHIQGGTVKGRWRKAMRLRRALDAKVCLRACQRDMGALMAELSATSRKDMQKAVGKECLVVLEKIFASVGHTVQWQTSTIGEVYRKPRLRVVRQ